MSGIWVPPHVRSRQAPELPFGLRELHFPPETPGLLEETPGARAGHIRDIRYYRSPGGLRVITSTDEGLLHLSVSRADRYPSWDEIHALKDWYMGDGIEAIMVLPRSSEYVNLHPNTFHVHQSKCGEEGR